MSHVSASGFSGKSLLVFPACMGLTVNLWDVSQCPGLLTCATAHLSTPSVPQIPWLGLGHPEGLDHHTLISLFSFTSPFPSPRAERWQHTVFWCVCHKAVPEYPARGVLWLELQKQKRKALERNGQSKTNFIFSWQKKTTTGHLEACEEKQVLEFFCCKPLLLGKAMRHLCLHTL